MTEREYCIPADQKHNSTNFMQSLKNHLHQRAHTQEMDIYVPPPPPQQNLHQSTLTREENSFQSQATDSFESQSTSQIENHPPQSPARQELLKIIEKRLIAKNISKQAVKSFSVEQLITILQLLEEDCPKCEKSQKKCCTIM